MKGMVLAAGVGSRLEPLTQFTPKPMVPLGNRPAMEHIVALLAHHGITDIAANLWYLPEQIKTYFGDGTEYGVNLYYSEERELLGTAGGIRKLANYFDETFVVIAGDALTDVDLTQLLTYHKTKGALATIAVKPVDDPTHYGVVVTDDEGKIKGFQEKPRPEEALSFTANTGIYIFEPEIMDEIPIETFYDFGKQVFPDLVAKGAPFYACSTRQYWCDVGTHQVYRQANLDIASGKVKMHTTGFTSVSRSLLTGDGCEIDPGASLTGVNVFGDGCQIAGGSHLRDSVLWDQVSVGRGVKMEEAIIGYGVTLKEGAVIPKGCVIGDEAVIGPGVKLTPGQIIKAETVLEA